MPEISEIIHSKFKFKRSDRIDVEGWHRFIKNLQEIFDIEYVDVKYKENKIDGMQLQRFVDQLLDDENQADTIIIKISSNQGISVPEACDFAQNIGNFAPDEMNILYSGKNFSIIRFWWGSKWK